MRLNLKKILYLSKSIYFSNDVIIIIKRYISQKNHIMTPIKHFGLLLFNTSLFFCFCFKKCLSEKKIERVCWEMFIVNYISHRKYWWKFTFECSEYDISSVVCLTLLRLSKKYFCLKFIFALEFKIGKVFLLKSIVM